jgi:hypothetical protein
MRLSSNLKMATDLENFFREVLVFLGDVHRLEIRLSDMRKKARVLGVDYEELARDFSEADKTLARLKNEANVLHDEVDNELK